MPTPVSESPTTVQQANGGVGGAAKSVAEHASAIARLEIELAVLELKKKVFALAVGIGMGIGAAILGIFGLGFVFLTIAAALATFLSTWLALLIVTLGLLTLAGLLGVLALGRIKKGTPPVPEQAIREAKLTTQALKH
jgi:4-amino-4-deoxy-L-arabinose transferase-like glycosyltransferase